MINGELLISNCPKIKQKTGELPGHPIKLKTPIPSEDGYFSLESFIFSIISIPHIEKNELKLTWSLLFTAYYLPSYTLVFFWLIIIVTTFCFPPFLYFSPTILIVVNSGVQ